MCDDAVPIRHPIHVALTVLLLAACDGEGPRSVSLTGAGAYEASLRVMDDGFVVAWHDHRDGNAEVYARLLDVRGRPQGPELRLTETQDLSHEADVEVVGDSLIVAWYERSRVGDAQAKVGGWTREGEVRWVRTLSAHEREGRNPVVRAGDGTLFCAWIEQAADGTDVWAQWLDLDGRPVSAPRRLAPAGPTTWNLNAELDDRGRAWVVFDATADTRAAELFVARVDEAGVEVARLTADDGFASKYPDLAFGAAGAALTWFDQRDGNREVYLAVASTGELEGVVTAGRAEPGRSTDEPASPFDRRALRVTTTPGESIGAYVAWNGRQFGLAWSDDSEGHHEIYFQAFDGDGTAAREPQRLTYNLTASLIPAIQPWADGFALVWNEDVVEERRAHGSGGRSEVVFTRVR